jgi:hypothetical protein
MSHTCSILGATTPIHRLTMHSAQKLVNWALRSKRSLRTLASKVFFLVSMGAHYVRIYMRNHIFKFYAKSIKLKEKRGYTKCEAVGDSENRSWNKKKKKFLWFFFPIDFCIFSTLHVTQEFTLDLLCFFFAFSFGCALESAVVCGSPECN